MAKPISYGKFYCDRCNQLAPAYYTLSHLTKGLYVQCPNCGNHARPYIENLHLPCKPSKAYRKKTGIGNFFYGIEKLESKGNQPQERL